MCLCGAMKNLWPKLSSMDSFERSCAESLAFCISSLVVWVPNEMSPGRPFARRVVAERC